MSSPTYTREDMARAWDEGYRAGWDDCDDAGCIDPVAPNPYRTSDEDYANLQAFADWMDGAE